MNTDALTKVCESDVAARVQCGTQVFEITNGLIAAYRKLTGVPSNADALVLLGGRTLATPSTRQSKMGDVISARHHGLAPVGGGLDAAKVACECGEVFSAGRRSLTSRVVHFGECVLAHSAGLAFQTKMRELLDAHVVEVRS